MTLYDFYRVTPVIYDQMIIEPFGTFYRRLDGVEKSLGGQSPSPPDRK